MCKKFIFFFLFVLLSCSSDKTLKTKKNEKIELPEVLYQIGIKEYEDGKLQSAVDILKKIQKNYSYTKFAPRALLMISYIYYESNDYIRALSNLKKFKELYPASKYISYADFLTAICVYEEINDISKDQSNTELALKLLKDIVKNYPNSIYADESNIRIDLINEQLAGHEMYIARFYMKKSKWISAILRLQIVIEKYPTTIFIDEALHRIVEVYYKIGNVKEAKKYAAILGYNFNDSEWYKRTYKIVGNKNYTNINRDKKKNLKDTFLSIFSFNKND